jgi:pimeloyl-ACP methyl ester carboxylesterase
MEWFIETPDGRTLAVEDAGDRDGRPVLVHVGTPGGRRLYGPRTLADAERRQLRLISYDRPGYGGSTPQPGRSTADCAGDVRVICEALGIERVAMWGHSGGGPHVLVPAVASLASLAPYDAEGLDWLAGFSESALEEVRLMKSDVGQISVPVLLLHGGQDRAVPVSHGQWLASHIPGVEARFFEDEGHSIRERHIAEIHAWLVERSF